MEGLLDSLAFGPLVGRDKRTMFYSLKRGSLGKAGASG